MMRHIPFVLLIALYASVPAHAQIFGGIFKRQRTEPTEKVPEIVQDLQGADKARSRTSTGDDTRPDSPQYIDSIRTLINTMENDANPSVRADAAQSLSRIRPVTQAAGQALERVASKDPVWRVRMQAWSALKMYQLAGYRNRGPSAVEESFTKQSSPTAPQAPNRSLFVEPPPQQVSTPIPSEPVPLTPLELREPEPAQYTVPRPLPVGAPWSTAVPTTPRRIAPAGIINNAPLLNPPPLAPPLAP